LGAFIPPLAAWLERREVAKQKRENGSSTVLQHVIASDTRGEMTQVSLIERMLGTLETSLERMWQDREKTSIALDNVHKQLSELRAVVARHNDLLGGHGQNIARLADEMEDVKTATAGTNGKLDSLGAWMETMQNLRREVGG
jgi:chromosome segregation ATPase